MLSVNSARSLFLALLALACVPRDAFPAIIYRIGTPFTGAERDSLDDLGVDYREIEWTASQVEEALQLDSLAAGSLQPNSFGEDEDIAATLLDRDGWVAVVATVDRCFCHWNRQVGNVLVDGDPTTSFGWGAVPAESFHEAATRATIGMGVLLDLGGRFLIREVRLRPVEGHPEHFLESYDLGTSDRVGELYYLRGLLSPIVVVRDNTEPEVSMILDPPVTTEAIHIKIFRDTPKEISMGAVEVYGGGYVSKASYESDVIELDDIASWGEIRWSGRRDPDARVEIRTRSGIDPQPDIYWEARAEQQDSVMFLQGGADLSMTEYKRQYDRLADYLKPLDERDWVSPDSENWSFWSSPYVFDDPGVAIASPGPRKYIQIRADFTSTVDNGGKIDYLEFKASVPPAVRRLVGEIYPIETAVGEPTRFTYYIRPTIRAGDTSFDAVEISTPSGVLSVDSLRLDGIDQGGFVSRRNADGKGFEVMLPRKLEPTDSGSLLEVVFQATVLREVGTLFEGKVFDTTRPNEVRQRVLPGDAANEIDSDGISVTTSLSRSLVLSPEVSPNPFTPNGDGVNDVVTVRYKLLRVTSAVPVTLEIFDVSGRLIKEVFAGDNALGDYAHDWDGTDNANRLVPPGLYLYRLVVDVQSGKETNTGVLSVAY